MLLFPGKKDELKNYRSGLYVKKIHGPDSEVVCIGAIHDPETEKVLGAWGEVVNGRTTFVEVSIADYPNLTPSQLRAMALKEAVAKNREYTISGLEVFLDRLLPSRRRRIPR
ncbi:MAG: hypothetical protein AB1411_02615 [Nitrospirota bacterium]